MSCPGLHCPGCSGVQSLCVLAGVAAGVFAAYESVAVVAEYIWWIIGTLIVCFALAVAASVWLERLSDARCARFAERHGIASRADVDALTPAGVAWLLRHQQQPAAVPVVIRAVAERVTPAPHSPYPRQPPGRTARHD